MKHGQDNRMCETEMGALQREHIGGFNRSCNTKFIKSKKFNYP